MKRFRDALDAIVASGIHIQPISPNNVLRAAELSQGYGLLTNDATVVSVMEELGIDRIASNDADFDRVPGFTRYSPT